MVATMRCNETPKKEARSELAERDREIKREGGEGV
jgi:hypothetical protein